MTDLEALLVSKLTVQENLRLIWDRGLREEVFVDDTNRAIFTWSLEYWRETQMQTAPTGEVLQYEFGSRYQPVVETEGEEVSLLWLVERLQDRYISNQLQDEMRKAATTTREDPKGTADKLWRAVQRVSSSVSPRLDRVDMSQTVEERRFRYLERVQAETARGMTLGLTELDNHIGGLLPGELAAVAGFTKTGKSWYLVNAAIQARRLGFTPLIFSLEQKIRELEERVDALWSGVSYYRLTHGELSMDESNQIRQAQEELAESGRFLIERPERGQRTVKHLLARARDVGCDFLIIDQLSFMDVESGAQRDTTSRHSEIIFELKDAISDEHQGAIPCLLAVQFNRASVNDKGAMSMSRLANASAIEQTVDLALGLSRSRELRANHAMRLDIMGSRRSDVASWLLHWELGARSRIAVREAIDV